MTTALFTPKARRDILEIEDYIAVRSEPAADDFLDALDEKCQLLTMNPAMGRIRLELGESTRSFPCGRYVIFYRPIDGGIEVLRVLHAARDLPSAWQS